MILVNSKQQYGLIAKILHWLVAVFIFSLIALGWYMVGLTYYDPWYYDSLNFHKAFGVIFLVIALVNSIWYFLNIAPVPTKATNPWIMKLTKFVHRFLLILTLIIPITGYFISTSEGDGINIFGILTIPATIHAPELMRDICIQIHYYCSYGILVLATLHASAAFKHQFIDKDGTLMRMIR